ncbi:TPA: cell envelope integrity protein TolA [Bacillus toyonensis]|nr:cell envelope integrity protein TolA [Bacillus toyonensis]
MQNNRKRNVIKERIRQEKERRERLLAEEEEQYGDFHEDQVSEQFQQEHLEQPLKQSEESVNLCTPKNEVSNNNPALDWITTIQKQSGTSESEFKIEEARRKAKEEARKQAEAEARRKAEEEARKQAEVEARRKVEEEARKQAELEACRKAEEAKKKVEAEARRKAEKEARKQAETEARRKIEEEARKQAELEACRKAEEKKLEEVRKRRLEEEKKIEEAQKRQKIVVAKRESESEEVNLNKETNPSNETKFEQEEKIDLDKKGILNYMKKYKYAIIGVASIVLLVVAGFAFTNMKNSQAASANNVNSLEVNVNLINGLRLSAVQKYQDAALEFDKVDYKKLGKDDKKAVLFTYLLSGKAQKAIDLEQDFAESVVSYYIAVDNLKKVKELKTKNPLINFEIAALDGKHEEVIKLKDHVPLDGRREGIIVNSYLKLNKSEEAKKFAQKVGNKDLLEKINNSVPNSSATSVATISAG